MPQKLRSPYPFCSGLVLLILVGITLPLLCEGEIQAATFTATHYQPPSLIYQGYRLGLQDGLHWVHQSYGFAYCHPGDWLVVINGDIGTGISSRGQAWWLASPRCGGWHPWGYSFKNAISTTYCPPLSRQSRLWRDHHQPWGRWRPYRGYIAATKLYEGLTPSWGRQPWVEPRSFTGRDSILNQPNLQDQPARAQKLAGKPTAAIQVQPDQDPAQPRKTGRLPAASSAGAAWAKPWKEGGPIVMDTRRSAPPTIDVTPPPAQSSPRRLDTAREISPRPVLDADQFSHDASIWYSKEPWVWQYYRHRRIYPQTLHPFQHFGETGIRRGLPAGRGIISTDPSFRGGRSGHRGGGFRGGGFRGR